jgi:hypothetical protein
LLKFINDNHIENVVFVAAEAHTYSVNNLTYQDHFLGPQIATSAIEVDTMAVASQLVGPQLPPLLTQAGILPPAQLALYNSLPAAGKDQFLEQLIDKTFLAPLGYDPIGLDNNLPATDGKFHAQLLQGSYFVSNDLGWTKFEVDADTQSLLVTTYGIPAYTTADLAANPSAVLASTPTIVSQFRLMPTVNVTIQGHERADPPSSSFTNVTFAPDAKGTLEIDGTSFSGQVSGFAAGDRLDFSDLAFGSHLTVGYDASTHHLTVSNGVKTADITLLGDYTASMFVTERDGHGGTLVTLHAQPPVAGWVRKGQTSDASALPSIALFIAARLPASACGVGVARIGLSGSTALFTPIPQWRTPRRAGSAARFQVRSRRPAHEGTLSRHSDFTGWF